MKKKRPKACTPYQIMEIVELVRRGIPRKKIAEKYGIKPQTITNYIRPFDLTNSAMAEASRISALKRRARELENRE